MAGTLTEAFINKATRAAAASGVRAELRDPAHRGLWLRVGKTGTRTWSLRARDRAGRPHWFTLGRHPAMGLAEARSAAAAMLVAVRAGANPIAEQRVLRATPPPAPVTDTLAALLSLYDDQRGRELRSWPESRKRVINVFGPLLPRPLCDLTAAGFQITADQYPFKQSASFAVRTLRPVLRWGARRGYCPRSLAEFEQPSPARTRHRVLTRAELAALLPVLSADPGAHAACMTFILLTACRLREATGACWREVDLAAGTWILPGARTKNGREHVIPLSDQARVLLRRRMPPSGADQDALLFASSAGTTLGHWTRAGRRFQQASGAAADWHRHDLRRTAATLMGELGVDPHIIEAALGHAAVHSGLASVYNKSRYTKQVGEALQLLANLLDGIEHGGATVVPLVASA